MECSGRDGTKERGVLPRGQDYGIAIHGTCVSLGEYNRVSFVLEIRLRFKKHSDGVCQAKTRAPHPTSK